MYSPSWLGIWQVLPAPASPVLGLKAYDLPGPLYAPSLTGGCAEDSQACHNDQLQICKSGIIHTSDHWLMDTSHCHPLSENLVWASISQHMLHYFWSCPEPNSLPLLSVVPWPSSVLLPMAGFHLDDSQAPTWLPFLLLSLFHSAGPPALPEHPIEMSSPLRSLTMLLPYLFPYLYSMALSLRFIFKLYIYIHTYIYTPPTHTRVCGVSVCGCLHNLEQSTGTPGAGVTGQCGLPNVGVGNCTLQEQCMLSSLQ